MKPVPLPIVLGNDKPNTHMREALETLAHLLFRGCQLTDVLVIGPDVMPVASYFFIVEQLRWWAIT